MSLLTLLLWLCVTLATERMGNTESGLEVPGGGSEGYHVLKVQNNSPGSRAGLESFFDFIIAVNGVRLVRGARVE